MKKLIHILLILLPLLANADTIEVTVTPEIPNKNEDPAKKRMPPKAPVVTFTDNTLLNVQDIPDNAELKISILENGTEVFTTITLDHEIVLPALQPDVAYHLLLYINGSPWSGYLYPD